MLRFKEFKLKKFPFGVFLNEISRSALLHAFARLECEHQTDWWHALVPSKTPNIDFPV